MHFNENSEVDDNFQLTNSNDDSSSLISICFIGQRGIDLFKPSISEYYENDVNHLNEPLHWHC